jgi:hypothetical protein
MTRGVRAMAVLMASAGLVGLSVEPSRAQAHVVVPIIIQARSVGTPGVTGQLGTARLGTQLVLVTVDPRGGPGGAGATGMTRMTVEDVSHANRTLGGPAPVATLGAASLARQTVTITSEAPIDAPIVILTP